MLVGFSFDRYSIPRHFVNGPKKPNLIESLTKIGLSGIIDYHKTFSRWPKAKNPQFLPNQANYLKK